MELRSVISSISEALFDISVAKILAVDTETTGLHVRDSRDFCIGISVAGRNPLDGDRLFGYYFPVAHTHDNISSEDKANLFVALEQFINDRYLVFLNYQFDRPSLLTAGFDGIDRVEFFDVAVATHMVNENIPRKSLDYLSKNLLKREGKKKDAEWQMMFELYGWSADFPADVMARYAIVDAEETLLIHDKIMPSMLRQGFM